MQNIFRSLVALLGMLLIASAVQARSTVPVVERANQPVVTGSGKPADAESVRKAIVTAGTQRNWQIAPMADGKALQGTYSWNKNKHTIMVKIEPGAAQYSVRYADSVNMKYEIYNGTPSIHPHYNKFVDELIQSIRVELLKL
jgi:hypothetical protein